jgi:hypothetical protein
LKFRQFLLSIFFCCSTVTNTFHRFALPPGNKCKVAPEPFFVSSCCFLHLPVVSKNLFHQNSHSFGIESARHSIRKV